MGYDKSFFDDDGEEYPYSVSFENGKYMYLISVVWNDRDAELVIQNSGSHLIFDDDGSWAVYRLPAEKIFPGKNKLSHDALLFYMGLLDKYSDRARIYTKDEIDISYEKFCDIKGPLTNDS